LANKSTHMMLDALARALAEPAGLPLFEARSGPGLFPRTVAARPLAKRCKDDGLLRVLALDNHGKQAKEICTITDKGRDWLLAQASPHHIMEDFVRVLEERQKQIAELQTATRNLAASLESLLDTVNRIASPHDEPRRNGLDTEITCAADSETEWRLDVLPILDQYHGDSAGDYPLPELFRRLKPSHSHLTIGRFHDGLRELHDHHQIYLHPWTGPLYQLPEPPFALLIGHFVAYYASLRNSDANEEDLKSNVNSELRGPKAETEPFRISHSAVRI